MKEKQRFEMMKVGKNFFEIYDNEKGCSLPISSVCKLLNSYSNETRESMEQIINECILNELLQVRTFFEDYRMFFSTWLNDRIEKLSGLEKIKKDNAKTFMKLVETQNALDDEKCNKRNVIKELEELKDDLLENFGQSSPWVNMVDLVVKINERIENLKGE